MGAAVIVHFRCATAAIISPSVIPSLNPTCVPLETSSPPTDHAVRQRWYGTVIPVQYSTARDGKERYRVVCNVLFSGISDVCGRHLLSPWNNRLGGTACTSNHLPVAKHLWQLSATRGASPCPSCPPPPPLSGRYAFRTPSRCWQRRPSSISSSWLSWLLRCL